MDLFFIVAIAAAALGVVLGALTAVLVVRLKGYFTTLMGKVEELEGALARKRHTNATDAGLLDMLAEMDHLHFNLDEMDARIQTNMRLVERCQERARQVRQGPYGYRDKEMDFD